MANEILILEQFDQGRRDRGKQINALFFYILDPQITIPVTGTVVSPTPSVTLPQQVTELNLLSAGELTALDDGVAIFESASLFLTEQESSNQPQALAKLRALYAASTFEMDTRRRFAFVGRRINA